MKKAIIITICLLLTGLFGYAAYNKLDIYPKFITQLASSPLKGYENFIAWFIPGIEILTCLLLLPKRTRLIGLYLSFFLMLAFTIYIYVVPHFYHSMDTCSCGGIIDKFSWKQHFWFNVGFLSLAFIGLCLMPTKHRKIQTA